MFKRLLSAIIIVTFFVSTLTPVPKAHADSVLGLPVPGTMVNLSPAYEPVLIKGLTVHKDNPFLFDFIVDAGHSNLQGEALKAESDRLIKYFFGCLTIPEKDLWVNLSPYEKDRMVPNALGQTALGRDLLAQDYILKQLTASLIYPEKNLGKEFWNRVYAKAQQQFGTTRIPVNTFNKVWILADKATVYEHNQTAFVVNGHLKVMLEEDYLALQKHENNPNTTHSIGSQIVRQIILPEIEKEVNTGKNFAQLRQIFNSLILATWYKKNLKEALLSQVYADKSTVNGVDLKDTSDKNKIYQQYIQAYKKGVFNYIKEEDVQGQTVPRKYFSGGFVSGIGKSLAVLTFMSALTAVTLSSSLSNGHVFDDKVVVAADGAVVRNVNSVPAVLNVPATNDVDTAMLADVLQGLTAYQAVLGVHFVGLATLAGAIAKSHYELRTGRNAKTIDEKIMYYKRFNKDILHIVGAMTILFSGLGLGGMLHLNIDIAPWLAGLVGITGSMIGGGIMGFETFAKNLLQAAEEAKANGNGINDPKLKAIEFFQGNPARNLFYHSQVPVFGYLWYLAERKPPFTSFWPTEALHRFIQHMPSSYHLDYIIPMAVPLAMGVATGIGLSVAFANKAPAKSVDPETVRKKEIEEMVKAIVESTLYPGEPDKINLNTSLIFNLKADDFDLQQLAEALEEEFKIQIPTDRLTTIGEIVDYIAEKTKPDAMKDTVEERVMIFLSDFFGGTRKNITLQSTFKDLNADPIDIGHFINEWFEFKEARISLEEIDKWRTVGDIVECVKAHIKPDAAMKAEKIASNVNNLLYFKFRPVTSHREGSASSFSLDITLDQRRRSGFLREYSQVNMGTKAEKPSWDQKITINLRPQDKITLKQFGLILTDTINHFFPGANEEEVKGIVDHSIDLLKPDAAMKVRAVSKADEISFVQLQDKVITAGNKAVRTQGLAGTAALVTGFNKALGDLAKAPRPVGKSKPIETREAVISALAGLVAAQKTERHAQDIGLDEEDLQRLANNVTTVELENAKKNVVDAAMTTEQKIVQYERKIKAGKSLTKKDVRGLQDIESILFDEAIRHERIEKAKISAHSSVANDWIREGRKIDALTQRVQALLNDPAMKVRAVSKADEISFVQLQDKVITAGNKAVRTQGLAGTAALVTGFNKALGDLAKAPRPVGKSKPIETREAVISALAGLVAAQKTERHAQDIGLDEEDLQRLGHNTSTAELELQQAKKNVVTRNSAKRISDKAALANINGGIDLNSANMAMTITKDANGGVKVDFDPAMIARIRKEGVRSVVPFIIEMTPMSANEIRTLELAGV